MPWLVAAFQDHQHVNTDDTLQLTSSAFADNAISPTKLQPYEFLVYNSATDLNVTGAGTTATVEFDSQIKNESNVFNTTTDTFTAPVTGTYQMSGAVAVIDLTAAMTAGDLILNTSNRAYQTTINPGAARNASNGLSWPFSFVVDMDANDTAIVQILISNGAGNTADVYGASVLFTVWGGYLIG
jgi:hypothetical protein